MINAFNLLFKEMNIRNISQAGKTDSSCWKLQITGNSCYSIKSTVLFNHNLFGLMVSLQHYQFFVHEVP